MYKVYNIEFHVFSFPILSEGREDLINVLIDDSQGKSHPRKTLILPQMTIFLVVCYHISFCIANVLYTEQYINSTFLEQKKNFSKMYYYVLYQYKQDNRTQKK